MKALSLDLRERILSSYDKSEGTRQEIADRYRVSLGMVKKLLQQRRKIGQIGPQHANSGRKPKILKEHQKQMRVLLSRKADMTLKELREALGLDCTVAAIHYSLSQIGLTYKKRRAESANKSIPKSPRRAKAGYAGN